VDFRDLSNAFSKDDFPLPFTKVPMDATTMFRALSFIDGFLGYNQIKMYPKDEDIITFYMPQEIYCHIIIHLVYQKPGQPTGER